MEIDDSLYSRQRYVLGDTAMQRMANSSVLLYGFGGLGAEIAKNIVLAGIKSLTVQDCHTATYHDLASQFFLTESDVQSIRNRAEASVQKIAELNPYVSVNVNVAELTEQTDLTYLLQYQCVILTETRLSLQLYVNKFCRTQPVPIKFVTADVYGVFCWGFSDFGPDFEVTDQNGEEPREVFILNISKNNPGVVSTLENRMHGFESGDTVTFKEVVGMERLNGLQCVIRVLTPYTFSICDTSGEEFGAYRSGGMTVLVKVSTTLQFASLEEQLRRPSLLTPDLSNLEAPANIHLGMQALHDFHATHCRLPQCRHPEDEEELLRVAAAVNKNMELPVSNVDETRLRQLARTCTGCLPPLCAFMGGVVVQEALKALTGKFTPITQWLCLDVIELCPSDQLSQDTFQPRGNRYDALRTCIGQDLCEQISNIRLFMVGCGAIGCEMLKNYAMLGVATSSNSLITITDNDVIEKSNLNRQFLFRPHHIRQPKSTTAAQSVLHINPTLHIDAQQHKVCAQTEGSVYSDDFFTSLNVIVNALDNIEARRYVDSRCVTAQRPLLESGTMGTKGHVQVIVPYLTETYSSQRDPPDEDVPYCTLKSFPAVIEHCIEWARDKFESIFVQKPSLYNKFWELYMTPQTAIDKLSAGEMLDGSVQVSKMASVLPQTWRDCVEIGRRRFDKYFNHKAKQLLHAFPLDTTLKDGTPFWQSPKRPPTPVDFDATNPLHMMFLVTCSRLLADMSGITWTPEDCSTERILHILSTVHVAEFQPKCKKIETDESAKKPKYNEVSGDELKDSAARLRNAATRLYNNGTLRRIQPLSFEKDDDSNGHIDFIAAVSNLRASMYHIDNVDRLKIKRIAGRIVPAIATTTAAVSGLVTLELMKLVKKSPVEHFKNCFLNLALPLFVFSEPAPVLKSTLSSGCVYTVWDRWQIDGTATMTVNQFIQALKEKYGLDATMVVQGVKMIYVPMMPGHIKRLPQPMRQLIKASADKPYVDLVVSYRHPDNDDEQMGPPVRYYY